MKKQIENGYAVICKSCKSIVANHEDGSLAIFMDRKSAEEAMEIMEGEDMKGEHVPKIKQVQLAFFVE